MKWTRSYEIEVDDEILDVVGETFGSGDLLDTITRRCDEANEGSLTGALYLYEDGDGPYWEDYEDPYANMLFGPVPFKVKEIDAGPDD